MKKSVIWILALCCCTTLFAARGKTTPPGWYDDYEAARKKAKELNRPILVLFTGSDWCGFCIKLRKNVLDKSDFKSLAAERLILFYADNPKRTKLPPRLLEQTRMLRNKLAGSSGGVPYTVIITPDEEELGNIGGCPRNPADYLKKVREIATHGKTTPPGWDDDYEAALLKAKKLNRAILVLFTGSDWCGFCIKLRKNVLDKSDFKSFAAKHLILVYADNPKRTKLPPGLLEQNRWLRQHLGSWAGAGSGVPYTFIITHEGEVLGSIGGCPRDPDDYLKQVREFAKSPWPCDYYLKKKREIRERTHHRASEIILRDNVHRIIFPRVVFNDTDVSSALQQLVKRSKGYDPEKEGIEINLSITKRQPCRVTMNLTNARVDDIIRSICVETGLQCRRVKSRTFDISDQ